jgi:hypothetical protein
LFGSDESDERAIAVLKLAQSHLKKSHLKTMTDSTANKKRILGFSNGA